MQETSDRLKMTFKSPSSHSTPRTLPAIRESLLISEFKQFHPDPNINVQLNRFLIPGLEQQFAQIGAKIKDFDDWKSQLHCRVRT